MNKKFTDIFVQRPVLAVVISLLIFFLGLRAIFDLQVREYPKVDNTVITVTTKYPGASAALIQGFITTPLEKDIAGASGIDYLTSQSDDNVSTIQAYIKLNYDPDSAFTEVMSKVAEAQSDLPKDAEQPVIVKDTGQTTALMYISFTSDKMNPEQLTDYISRVVQPRLETVQGVSQAEILGGQTFAMRIWLNSKRMAALGVTPNSVAQALQTNNFQTTAGSTKGEFVASSIDAKTDVQNVEGFKNIVIKSDGASLVHLRDVADVELGAENYNSSVTFNGKKAIFIAINSTPTANPLTVINDVRALLPSLEAAYPPSVESKIVYDATIYIKASLREVITTIIEASLIVIVVIFLFLGSLRTVLIPVVTIPLSLIGVCGIMLALGYSINLLTLLAMVLAIGMVVDDAIVVVENIYRHIEEGLSAYHAALVGAREIAMPIISMTITLAAVYAPIGLMTGLTGALFKEFAFTLASSVILSGVVALTLSPMMCSRVLSADISQNKLVNFIDQRFDRLRQAYEHRVRGVLKYRPVTVVFALLILTSCVVMFVTAQSELAPDEDQGALFVSAKAPDYANLDYTQKFTDEFNKIYDSFPSKQFSFIINGGGGTVTQALSGFIMKPWDERTKEQSQAKVRVRLQEELRHVAGVNAGVFPLPSLPVGGDPFPVQFVITSMRPLSDINRYAQQLMNAAQKSGLFIFTINSLSYDKPQIELNINRDKAAQLGLNMKTIGDALSTAIGENNINRFSMDGYSYKVIPQVGQQFRFNPDDLKQIYVQAGNGALVPLSTVVSLGQTVVPNSLTRFQQQNSATLKGMLVPGHTMSEALAFLDKTAQSIFPQGVGFDYAGQSRQYIEEGHALVYTFMFSLIVIFLVLAAQFESFRAPLVILISVPMSICGALIPLSMGIATINIYTQVGLITLIGLISKHGILMVEFANQLQRTEGLSVTESIIKSAAVRLRPILMTTAAMVVGVVPLIIASGAGAISRFDIGLVIASGMTIGTLFTLFVVPTMYTLITKPVKQLKSTEVPEPASLSSD